MNDLFYLLVGVTVIGSVIIGAVVYQVIRHVLSRDKRL